LVIIKRNRTKPLALVDAEYFIRLHNDRQANKTSNEDS